MFRLLVEKGKGGVILIDGCVGSGKTRLVREVLRDAKEANFILFKEEEDGGEDGGGADGGEDGGEKERKRRERSERKRRKRKIQRNNRGPGRNSPGGSMSDGKTTSSSMQQQQQQQNFLSLMSAADPISQFVPFSGIFEVSLHMLRKLRCVEEYVEYGTGVRTLKLKTRRTRVSGDVNSSSLLSRLHLLQRVFPQLSMAEEDEEVDDDDEEEEEEDKARAVASRSMSSSISSSIADSSENGEHRAAATSSATSDMFDSMMPVDEANELHEGVRDILLQVVSEYVQMRAPIPIVLTFDDGQWMDAWSWSLISHLKTKIELKKWKVLLVTATRTTATVNQEGAPPETYDDDDDEDDDEDDSSCSVIAGLPSNCASSSPDSS